MPSPPRSAWRALRSTATRGLCPPWSRRESRSPACARWTMVSASFVKELGVFVATMTDLDRRGVETIVREAPRARRGRGVRPPLARHGRGRPRRWRPASEPRPRRALLSRGAPRDGAGRGGRRPHLGRGRRGEPDPRSGERHGRACRARGERLRRLASPSARRLFSPSPDGL